MQGYKNYRLDRNVVNLSLALMILQLPLQLMLAGGYKLQEKCLYSDEILHHITLLNPKWI